MAEVIGLAASAVTLAALFSNCIDCFSYFRQAQNCTAEAESLLVKLDCEKARLLVWANTVGIFHTNQQRRYPQLADSALLRRCIDQIIALLTDGQKLQAEYGSRPTAEQESQRSIAVVSVNSMNMFKTAKLRFFARAGGLTQIPTILSRIKWAIRDGAKFRILLFNLKEFVEHILQLVPVPLEVINNTVEEDITTIFDIGTLRLAEVACEESYPSWSARASEVIRDSEIGTIDRRNFEEIGRDLDDSEVARQLVEPNTEQDFLDIGNLASKTFVILTDKCLDLEADSHCESATIGRAVTDIKDLSFTCSNNARWNLGRRVMANIQSPFMSDEEMAEVESRRFQVSQLTGSLPEVSPVSRIYIHCGPCVCAVQTALKLTAQNGASEYFDFAIRIDDRLPTSCRRSSTAVEILAAIRDNLEGYVVNSWNYRSTSIGFIDCPELDRRIYKLLQEDSEHSRPGNVLQPILLDYPNGRGRPDLPVGAIVIIAESDHCSSSLGSQPFRREATQPRETNIFTFKLVMETPLWVWRRTYVGSYSRSKAAIEKNRARSDPLTDLIPPPISAPM